MRTYTLTLSMEITRQDHFDVDDTEALIKSLKPEDFDPDHIEVESCTPLEEDEDDTDFDAEHDEGC